MRVGVLGGGALGLTAAFRVAQAGHHAVVLERDRAVGGLAGSFQVGGSYLEKFYHHLFQTDQVIVDLIRELGLGDLLHWGRPKTSNLIGGKAYQLDSVRSVLRFQPLSPLARLQLGMGVAALKALPSHKPLEGQTAAAWIRRWMGSAPYRIVWEPLLKAKFGAYYDQIAAPWFWSRVHLRTPSLGYLRGGFHQLYGRLAERIAHLGSEVRLGQEVSGIAAAPEGCVSVVARTPDGPREEVFDAVIATLPTRLFFRLVIGLPDAYRSRYDFGDHYGAHCAILALSRQLLVDGTYWLSVNDPGYPFLAAVEHTNFIPPEEYQGLRLVYLGNYLPMSHPLFGQSDEEVIASYLPHLRRLNPRFEENWVQQAFVFKSPFAQPIVTVDFHEHIPPLETPIQGLYLANMFQVYPQDRGQNYSVKLANEVAKLVVERGR